MLQGLNINHLESVLQAFLNAEDGKRFRPVVKAFPVLLSADACGGEAQDVHG